ncbi:MAG: hypothetical protein P0121_02230 [Nitrospira sp.]|nr:hypothetical protein [Nitrospira sp.]
MAKPASDLARDIKPDTIIVGRLKDYAWKIGVDVQRLRFDAAGVSESSGLTNIEIPLKDQIKTDISQDPGKRIYQKWVGTGLSVDTSLVNIDPPAASAITIKVNNRISAIVENLIAGDPSGIIRRVLIESGQTDQWRKEISGSLSLEGLSVTEIADPNTNLQKTVIHVPLLTRGSQLAKADMAATKSWIIATFPNAQLGIALTTEGFTLRRGLNYARGAIGDYQDGLRQHAYLRTGMNLLLIPLAAAAVGMGVAGSNATSIAALSLSGGAVYGIGNVLSSRPREKLYAQGIKAINCAVKVMLPLNLPDSIYERLVIGLAVVKRNESSLVELLTEVSNLESKVETANQNSNALSGTKDSLTRARSALAVSQKVRADGSTLQGQIEGASDRLIQSVTEIQGLVEVTPVFWTGREAKIVVERPSQKSGDTDGAETKDAWGGVQSTSGHGGNQGSADAE